MSSTEHAVADPDAPTDEQPLVQPLRADRPADESLTLTGAQHVASLEPPPPVRISGAERHFGWVGRPLYYATLLLGAASMVVPFLWMLSTSLKLESNVFRFPPEWIPDPARFQNYPDALSIAPFARYLANSAFVSVTDTFFTIVVCALAAYAFARLRFPLRNTIFVTVLATMMVPFHVELIPQFILMRQLGWIDTYYALIVPSVFWPFGIFLHRPSASLLPVRPGWS